MPDGGRHLEHGLLDADGGAVDEHVETAERRDGGADGAGHLLEVEQVDGGGAHGDGAGRGRALGRDLREAVAVATPGEDGGALAGEGAHDGAADAARATSDEDSLVREPRHAHLHRW